MFYALTVVTLLATILFYSFYPRNDGVKTVDMPREKAILTQMVAQHNAAVEAARIVEYDTASRKNRMAYEYWISQRQMTNGDEIPTSLYSSFLPAGFQYAYYIDPQDGNARVIPTALWCVDNDTQNISANCAVRKADRTTGQLGTTDLIVSYMESDNNLQYRALGEMVFLTDYSQQEHLKTNCGLVVCGENVCALNNTRYQTVSLPHLNGEIYNFDGMLMCVTQLSVARTDDGNVVTYE